MNKSDIQKDMERIAEECGLRDQTEYCLKPDSSLIPIPIIRLKPVEPMAKREQPLNSKCKCGSGRKYKKCCFEQNWRYNNSSKK